MSPKMARPLAIRLLRWLILDQNSNIVDSRTKTLRERVHYLGDHLDEAFSVHWCHAGT
jgi:hypothetical protein